jgi:hypothetical protein
LQPLRVAFDTPQPSFAFHTGPDEASLRKVPMNLIAPARRLLALFSRRAVGPRGEDPAEMGTAFGLDAMTTLEPEAEEAARREAGSRSRFEHRLHRRSSY